MIQPFNKIPNLTLNINPILYSINYFQKLTHNKNLIPKKFSNLISKFHKISHPSLKYF